MPRLYPFAVSLLIATSVACTDPPKPTKASKEDLAKIEKDDKHKKSTLGAIPSGPVAKVGSVEIPGAKFAEVYDLKIKKYTDRGREIPTSADRRYRKSIAQRLIYHEVLRQEAQALGVKYDPKDLEAREAQQKQGIRDWEKHLSRRGETEGSLKAMYVAELQEKAILAKSGKLEVVETEIDADYEKIKGNWKSDKERVRASHILVPVGPAKAPKRGEKPVEPSADEQAKWDAEAKAKAAEYYKLVSAPDADFAAVAREHSTGPSAAKGGDIGIFTADRMAEEFSAVAFALKIGTISEPVKTKFGYHVIKVIGKWPAGELPKDALRDQIVERLRQRKLHQGRRELKEELLEKYTIVDNIKATLGPEPVRKAPAARHGRDPHKGQVRRDKNKGMKPSSKGSAKATLTPKSAVAPAGKPAGKPSGH